MHQRIWKACLGGIILAAAIQLIPIDRSNPPVTAELTASNEILATFRRACYDCHSNETIWPWYSRVAPVSWLVAADTWEGREHLNFSTWNHLPPEKQQKLRKEIWKSVDEGEMPPWVYLLNHAEAKLDQSDRAVIQAWTLAVP
jgi:Haem-binding domain